MVFQKAFPKRTDKTVYPRWEEVELSDEEERAVEEEARVENVRLMKECLRDAKRIIEDSSLKDYQSDLVGLAVALFEKRASHVVWWKEKAAKEKFDKSRDESSTRGVGE